MKKEKCYFHKDKEAVVLWTDPRWDEPKKRWLCERCARVKVFEE